MKLLDEYSKIINGDIIMTRKEDQNSYYKPTSELMSK